MKTRSIVFALLALLFLSLPPLHAQTERDPVFRIGEVDTAKIYNIEEVTVRGQRPLKEIGVQKTELDTTVLHDNIALSMADVLTQNSTLFIKSFGRATLSTASFRGTSASHTQVTWNGMKINSPMLGMVDFSMIPAYFIDNASLLHGTSSVNLTGGGLGGAISLSTAPLREEKFGLQYIQGIGSFSTFDEYLRLTYGSDRWQYSTRVSYSSSPNDYRYTNYMRKVNMVYDDDRNLISFDYPTERNKSGQFKDFHILQEACHQTETGHRFGISAWYLNSSRGVALLNVDYKEAAEYTNEQSEQTFRGVLSWDKYNDRLKLGAKAGYVHTDLGYDYSRDKGNGEWVEMIRSRSYVNTLYGQFESEYVIGRNWMFTANLSLHQHFVKSQDKNIITQDGNKAVVGYDQARIELSAYLSAKWKPNERFGLSLALRDDMYGTDFTPPVPAAFFDYLISKKGNVIAKASVSRNYRYPTLNDLYFLPGGNPDLRTEKGFTYDGGVEFTVADRERFSLKGEVTAFDSYIDDWILWLPTFKGFWSPVNVKKVHAYGIEAKGSMGLNPAEGWRLKLDGNYAWTPSINHGDPVNWADESIGKQLVYIPEHSAALTGQLSWRQWTLGYKWCYYDERFTTSSNETLTKTGRLLPYFMSDISLEKRLSLKCANVSFKGVVNNIFNEEYESVLSRPMPRTNFEIFLEIRPKLSKKR